MLSLSASLCGKAVIPSNLFREYLCRDLGVRLCCTKNDAFDCQEENNVERGLNVDSRLMIDSVQPTAYLISKEV